MTDFIITEDFPKNEAEFDERFSNEQTCYDYLFKIRWPQGFICRRCAHTAYWKSYRNLYICRRCEHQHSLTAGTILHSSKKPLRCWFKAMWWFTTRKSGINALSLQDLLGLGSYSTAWIWLHKLRRCTIRTEREKLSGIVEVDEFYLGGPHPGKRGRGTQNPLLQQLLRKKAVNWAVLDSRSSMIAHTTIQNGSQHKTLIKQVLLLLMAGVAINQFSKKAIIIKEYYKLRLKINPAYYRESILQLHCSNGLCLVLFMVIVTGSIFNTISMNTYFDLIEEPQSMLANGSCASLNRQWLHGQ